MYHASMPADDHAESLAQALGAALDALIRRAGLPRVQQRLNAAAGASLDRSSYWLARCLAECGGIRLSDLADLQGTDLSTVSRQVRASERAGLVERRPHPADARATLVHLTPHGRAVLERLRAVQRAEILAAVSGWSEADQQTLARLLSRFAAQFLAWAVADAPEAAPRRPQ